MFKFDDILMSYVRKNLETNCVPMLLGEPGIGKSSWLENLASLMHTKCFTLACNQLADKADLTGARLIPFTKQTLDEDGNVISEEDDGKQQFYPHAVIYDAIEYAQEHPRETPILFLDEINRTTSDVTSSILSLVTMRAIGTKRKLPPNLRLVIAGNDKGNIVALDEASTSRFVLYHVTPDKDTFVSINTELNPFIKNVLNAHPECIFCKQLTVGVQKDNDNDDDDDSFDILETIDDGETLAQITTPRTISALSSWLNTFSNQELMAGLSTMTHRDDEDISVLQEAIEGHVGRTNFTIYLMNEIATNIMNTNNQSSVMTISKPTCYDAMKQCPDITALNAFFDTLTDAEQSNIMLYALYENEDNGVYIKTLAQRMTRLESADTKALVKLSALDKLDTDNLHILSQTNTPLSATLSIILEN